MREQFVTLRQALSNGLVPSRYAAPNTPYLTECYNLRPSADGLDYLVPPTEITAFSAPTTSTWPYPQVIETSKKTYMAYLDTGVFHLAEVNLSTWAAGTDLLATGMYDLIASAVHNPVAPTTTKGNIQTAELDGLFVMTNGDYLWCLDATFPHATRDIVGWRQATGPVPSSVLYFNSRMIYGGLYTSSSFFSSTHWTDLWTYWVTHTPSRIGYQSTSFTDVDPNQVVMIGLPRGGDYDYPLRLELAALSGYASSSLSPFLTNAIDSGDLQFVVVPAVGKILTMLPVGDRIIVYGTQSMAVLRQGEDGYFSAEPLSAFGIANRSAVTIVNGQHCFVERNGGIWKYSSTGGYNRIGIYPEIDDLITTTTSAQDCVVMLADEYLGDVYISNLVKGKGYILTPTGLAQVKQIPSALLRYDQTLRGRTYTYATEGFQIVSARMDMNRRAYKTIGTIEVGHELLSGVSVSVDYRYDISGAYTRLPFTLINREGVAYKRATAADLKVIIKGTVAEHCRLNYITLHYQAGDLRPIRGLTENNAEQQ